MYHLADRPKAYVKLFAAKNAQVDPRLNAHVNEETNDIIRRQLNRGVSDVISAEARKHVRTINR